jgi:hypothetical protein
VWKKISGENSCGEKSCGEKRSRCGKDWESSRMITPIIFTHLLKNFYPMIHQLKWKNIYPCRWSVHLSVCPHDEILRNLLMWKTGYVAIASRRGEGRGNQLMSKTGYVEIASRLVTVAHSCFSCF